MILRPRLCVYLKYALNCPPQKCSIQILVSGLEHIHVNKMYPYGEKSETGLEPKCPHSHCLTQHWVFQSHVRMESPRLPFRPRDRQQRLPWKLPDGLASRGSAGRALWLTSSPDEGKFWLAMALMRGYSVGGGETGVHTKVNDYSRAHISSPETNSS